MVMKVMVDHVNELHVMVDNVNELHVTIVHYVIMITSLIMAKPRIWVEINQCNPEKLKLNMVILMYKYCHLKLININV
jgi:hypothetical protein